MISGLKISVVILGLVFLLSGCAEVNTTPASTAPVSREPTMFKKDCPAILMTEEKSAPVQLIAPKNKEALAAMFEAMPVIEKVLGVFRCIQNRESYRLLNAYAVPGRDMTRISISLGPDVPIEGVGRHDRSLCTSVSVLDQWVMLEKDSLRFNVTFIAGDTDGRIRYQFLFRKTEDDSWKLESFDYVR